MATKRKARATEYETIFAAFGFDADGDLTWDIAEDKESALSSCERSGAVDMKSVLEIKLPKPVKKAATVPTKKVTL